MGVGGGHIWAFMHQVLCESHRSDNNYSVMTCYTVTLGHTFYP